MAGAGLQFLNTILIARTLGDVGSERYFFWSAIIMTSTGMASYGLEQLSLRDVPRLQLKGTTSVRTYLTAVQAISVSLALIIGLGLVIYAQFTEGWAEWQILIPFGLAAMTTVVIFGEVLKGLSQPVLGVLFGHFLPVFIFTIAIALAGSALTSALLLKLWIGSFLLAVLLLRFSGQPELKGHPFKKSDPALLKSLFIEGRSVFAGGIFGALSFMIPLAILKSQAQDPEVSYVTTAFRISILISILSGAIHSVFAPQISRAAESFDARRVFKSYSKAVIFSLVALGPPIFIGVAFPQLVMQIFGESFRDGASTLRLLLICNLISLILGPVLQLLIMIGSNRHLPRFGFFKLMIAVAAGWVLIPKFGGVGMVVAMSGAFLLEELAVLIYIGLKLRKYGPA